MDWMERCVPDVEQLLSTYWRKEPVLLRPQDPPLEVLTLSDVDTLLDAGLLRVPYVGLYTARGASPTSVSARRASSPGARPRGTSTRRRCDD